MRRAFYYGLMSLCLSINVSAQLLRDTERDAVAMRMIGHEVMLWQGDSTQALPPVIELDNWTYRINFQTEIQFDPTELVDFIGKVMTDYSIAHQYRVQVRSCQGDSIIYSYQVGGRQAGDIIPCLGREQEKACYYLQIKILDYQDKLSTISSAQEVSKEQEPSFTSYGGLTALILFASSGIGWYFWSRKNRVKSGTSAIEASNALVIGATEFNHQGLAISFDDSKTELSAKEADLLAFLAKHLNQRVAKEQILKAVWGDEGDYVGRTLDVFISKIRKKLAPDASIRIVNIRGMGYQLLVES